MSEQCAYCGSENELTRDHIPPKNLFSKPRPYNLITVPSCKDCNLDASGDDEYFRLMLSMRHDTFEHPDIQETWEKIFRGLRRPSHPGLKKSLLRSIRKKEIISDTGLYLGDAATYEVNFERMGVVVSRISKGLFYHHKGYRLPDEYFCESFAVEGFKGYQPEVEKKIIELSSFINEAERNVLGDNVFIYKMRFFDEEPDFGVIGMSFYNQVYYLTLIGKKNSRK